MSTAFHKVFKKHQNLQPQWGRREFFAFDAHQSLKPMCQTWVELYGTMAISRKEGLRDKILLKQEIKNLSDNKDKLVKKLAGELNACRLKLREVKDALAERGTTIFVLMQHITALLI